MLLVIIKNKNNIYKWADNELKMRPGGFSKHAHGSLTIVPPDSLENR